MRKPILPNSTIGIIGGGQLGKMIAQAAKTLGYKTAVLDPSPDNPSQSVCDISLTANYDDEKAHQEMGEICDVVTYEFENISAEAIQHAVEKQLFYLPQGHEPLRTCQNRQIEKNAILDCDELVAPFQLIKSENDLNNFASKHGFPFILKTCTSGYDGKGQIKVESSSDFSKSLELIKQQDCIAEKFVSFDKEISVIVFRSVNGEITTLNTCENIHKNGILEQTISPARITASQNLKAQKTAHNIMEKLGFVGTLAIEMFLVDETILINEMAPRPHNSGHFSIEGASYSQFEQHIRSICGLPLGPNGDFGTSWMINILGQHYSKSLDYLSKLARPNAYFHIYGKQPAKVNRKMGHVTFVQQPNDSFEDLQKRAQDFLNQVILS